jgi:predicted RNase H-like nuclease (RuvC/YqgF family)
LLDIFGELEEQNLSLIQNSQETEESLDQMKNNIATQKKKMDDETEVLKQQIAILENAIQKEEERARELEQKSMIFAHSQHHQTDEEKAIEKLNRRVKVKADCRPNL